MSRIAVISLILIVLLLSACASESEGVTPAADTPVLPTEEAAATDPAEAPTEEAAPTEEPAMTEEAPEAVETAEPLETTEPEPLSFEAARYIDQEGGFEFPYPATWTAGERMVLGDRAYAVQFMKGDSITLQATLYRWDPQNDLAAYTAQRELAWDSSGTSVVEQKEITLPNGHPGVSYLIEGVDGETAYFFFTDVADRYLELSGTGDVSLLAEIAGHLRVIEPGTQAGAYEALGCRTVQEGTVEWVACNVMDGITSRNLSALHGYMTDPFTIGYWLSEGREASPAEITQELMESRLPADRTLLITFTANDDEFPLLQGMDVEQMFGPDLDVELILYSEGWGPDGQGAALLYFIENEDSEYVWTSMIYSAAPFDQ